MGYKQVYLYFWKRSELMNVVIVNKLVLPGTRFCMNSSLGQIWPILFSDTFSLCSAYKVLHPNKTACTSIATNCVIPKYHFIKAYRWSTGKTPCTLNLGIVLKSVIGFMHPAINSKDGHVTEPFAD